MGTRCSSALARRIAMRVSRSGAVRSAIRPHSKRLRRRSSRVDDRLRRPVGREHDLLAVLVDGVERVEELFLRPLLVGDELDVVDEQQVDAPVARPEVVDPALLDAGDELVGELLAGGVDDALAREARHDLRCRWRASGGSCRGPRRRTGTAGCRRGRGARRPTGSRRGRGGWRSRR